MVGNDGLEPPTLTTSKWCSPNWANCLWYRMTGSNCRPLSCKGIALPTELIRYGTGPRNRTLINSFGDCSTAVVRDRYGPSLFLSLTQLGKVLFLIHAQLSEFNGVDITYYLSISAEGSYALLQLPTCRLQQPKLINWCTQRDSNPQSSRPLILSQWCIPVPTGVHCD